MRRERTLLIGLVLSLGLALGGCESLGLDSFDGLFNQKKPLPGDRKAVFPDGVPGVPQGVPPELVRGYQPPLEPTPPVVAEEPKPKPAPRPKQVATPKPATNITVQPAPQRPPPQTATRPQSPNPQAPPSAWPQPGGPAPASSPFPPPPPPPQ